MGMESKKRVRGMGTESKKKEYRTPELAVHGDIDELTRSGALRRHTDVPWGTSVEGKTFDDITS